MAFKCGRCLRLFDDTPGGSLSYDGFSYAICQECNGEVITLLNANIAAKQALTAGLVAAQTQAQALTSQAQVNAVQPAIEVAVTAATTQTTATT